MSRVTEVSREIHNRLAHSGVSALPNKVLIAKCYRDKYHVMVAPDEYCRIVLAYLEAKLNSQSLPQLKIRLTHGQLVEFPMTAIWPLLGQTVDLPLPKGKVKFEIEGKELDDVLYKIIVFMAKREAVMLWGPNPPRKVTRNDMRLCRRKSEDITVFFDLPGVLSADNKIDSGETSDEEKAIWSAAYAPCIASVEVLHELEPLRREMIRRSREILAMPVEQRSGHQLYLKESAIDRHEHRIAEHNERYLALINSAKIAGLSVGSQFGLTVETHSTDFLPPGEWFDKTNVGNLLEGESVSLAGDVGDIQDGSDLLETRAPRERTVEEMKAYYVSLGCRKAWEPANFLHGRKYLAFMVGSYVILDTTKPNNAIYVLRLFEDDHDWKSDAVKTKREVITRSVRFVLRMFHSSTWKSRLRDFLTRRF